MPCCGNGLRFALIPAILTADDRRTRCRAGGLGQNNFLAVVDIHIPKAFGGGPVKTFIQIESHMDITIAAIIGIKLSAHNEIGEICSHIFQLGSRRKRITDILPAIRTSRIQKDLFPHFISRNITQRRRIIMDFYVAPRDARFRFQRYRLGNRLNLVLQSCRVCRGIAHAQHGAADRRADERC